jgi:hypothetical protein
MVLSLAAVRPVRRAALCLLNLAGAAQAGAGPLAAPERKLKAAYLYRVATFVDWPDAAFARLLEAVRSRSVLTVCDGEPEPGCVVALATW